jgi:uncharacterized protein (TIRG00374 family)
MLQPVPCGYDGYLGETNSRRTRSRVFLVLTNLVAIGCLLWTLRDAHLGEFRDDLATMNWWWVGVAVVAELATYFWHGLRWSLLLRPVVRVTYWQAVQSIFVGLFVNEVLPFRAGEVLRCYMLSLWTELPLSVSLTSALIERIFDGIWLCLCLVLTLMFVPFPRQLRYLVDGGYLLGFFVLVGAVLLGLAMFRRRQTRAAFSNDSWHKHLRVLIDDLSLIGHSRYLYLAFLQSLPYLLLQAIPVYAAIQGYGFPLSLGVAFALMVILRLGSAVPQAPGNLGVFQFLAAESLVRIFNVVPDEAKRFSLVLWGIVTLPLLIAGFISLSVTGAEIGELRKAAQGQASELSKSRP